LTENPEFELDELAEIPTQRGSIETWRRQVARQLMAKECLSAHAHDELGISEITTARPVQAALTSAVIVLYWRGHAPTHGDRVRPRVRFIPIVSAASLGFLAFLGAIGRE